MVPVVAGSIPVVRPITPSRLVGLVLAGGRALRLGGVDKTLLTLRGRTLADHVLARLADQVAAIAISANGDPARFAHFGCPVLADTVAGRGPLGGVLRGLDWAADCGATAILTVPGDTPFVPDDLAARLGAGPVWAENSAGIHPLVAVWPTACRDALAAWLAATPSGRVQAFGATIGMRAVWFDDTPDPFHNINTQADLDQARSRA